MKRPCFTTLTTRVLPNRGTIQALIQSGVARRGLLFLVWISRYTLFALGTVGIVLAIWLVPYWQVQWYGPPDPDRVNSFRATLIQTMAGIVVLYGVYLTSRRIAALEKQAEVATENLRLIEVGQSTERFSRAIDHIGSEQLQVRIGGIYALRSIATDQAARYESEVLDVLASFVRLRSIEVRALPRVDQDRWNATQREYRVEDTDLTSAVDVLCGLIRRRQFAIDGHALDLGGCEMKTANLVGANLTNANLDRANLRGAHMEGATLVGANLFNAELSGANLRNSALDETELTGAQLVGANLEFATMRDTAMIATNLGGANLRHAVLDSSALTGANLEQCKLYKTSLKDSVLSYARLKHAESLTCDQLAAAYDWENANRDEKLACGKPIPPRERHATDD